MEGGAGMTIGICSLWHNAVELLPEFERLLLPGGWDEAILIDNASSPEARAAYARTAERTGCKVLTMATNNVIRGWNGGMAALSTDIKLCMANDLIMVRPDWIVRATRDVGPGTMAGELRRFVDGTLYIDGSLIACHALDWGRLGGLDEAYTHPGYVSDVDLCWRAQQLGIVLRPMMGHSILHLGNYSTGTKGGIHPTWPANRDRFLAKKKAADNGPR